MFPIKAKITKLFVFSFLIVTGISQMGFAQFEFDIEGGVITHESYNRVRIPGDEGTLFDFKEDFESSPTFFYRLRAGYTISERHTFSLLFAPLTKTYSNGLFEDPVSFSEEQFSQNVPIDGRYKFNSYRLTYRYRLVNRDNFNFGLGLTGKIRDAAISLSQQNTTAAKTDFGFVPLINFHLLYNFSPLFFLLFEGDALVGPQGRAEDIFLGLGYQIIDNSLSLKAGYRVLEGGADNDEVYNFSWFNYISAGIILRL